MKRLSLLLLCFPFLLAACAGKSGSPSEDILSKVAEGIVKSENYELLWQQDKSRNFSTAAEAQEYAGNLRLGGYTDWRIPTKAESHNLFYSIDFGESSAKELGLRMDGAIWVELDNGEAITGEWDTEDTCCIVRIFVESEKGRVRAVRSISKTKTENSPE